MEKIEKLYRLAVKYRTSFTFYRSEGGNLSVSLCKNGMVLDYSVYDNGCEWICAVRKSYQNINDAIRDYEDYILLNQK